MGFMQFRETGRVPERDPDEFSMVLGAATFLRDDGISLLTYPPEHRPTQLEQEVRAADARVRNYLARDARRQIGDSQTERVSARYHHFEVAGASSLDRARELLGAYDGLRPYELPDHQRERKEALIRRWLAVQVLGQHRADDIRLAPEVSAPQCELPEGFLLGSVESYPHGVAYKNRHDMVCDSIRYNQMRSVGEPTGPAISPSYNVAEFFCSNADGDHTVMAHAFGPDRALGVYPIERYANAVGRRVEYTDTAAFVFYGPAGSKPNTAVPFEAFADTLAAVTGRDEAGIIVNRKPSSQSMVLYFAGGRISFNGLAENHTLCPPVHHENRSAFEIHLQLGQLPNDVLTNVARRLSAWQHTLQAPK
jgi:hypothetical protein